MLQLCYYSEKEWLAEKKKLPKIKKKALFSTLNSKQVLLMRSLIQFYRDEQNLNKLLPIIQKRSNLSLRIIDWFVTKYAKNNSHVVYDLNGSRFMVHLRYKAQLKAYSKKQFDPFCRRERIYLCVLSEDGEEQEAYKTTVGQLNFFRWAIKNEVLEYIEKNLKEINQAIRSEEGKNKKTRKKRPGRKKLVLSASKQVSDDEVIITVHFDSKKEEQD